jgi:hypothetical protein
MPVEPPKPLTGLGVDSLKKYLKKTKPPVGLGVDPPKPTRVWGSVEFFSLLWSTLVQNHSLLLFFPFLNHLDID